MILDKPKDELAQVSADDEHVVLTTDAAAPPSYVSGAESANTSSSTSAVPPPSSSPIVASQPFDPQDHKHAPEPSSPSIQPLPYIFPPLYSPSPSSPFLLAHPPPSEIGVSSSTFLTIVRDINASIRNSTTNVVGRTMENVIADAPLANLVYVTGKAMVGLAILGFARGTAAAIDLGRSDGPATRTMDKVSASYWARPLTILPPSTLSLLQHLNSPLGPFPPSSGLLLTILPFSALPTVLAQYPAALLADVPAEVARAMMLSGAELNGTKEVGVERKKALRVRARVNFRSWGFVRLEGEGEGEKAVGVGSDEAEAEAARPTRPKPTPTYSSGGTGSRFSHVDEKLAARRSRRNLPSSKKVKEGGAQDDAGYDAGVGKVADGTWFLVLVKRDLEGLEGAPGMGEKGVGVGRKEEGTV